MTNPVVCIGLCSDREQCELLDECELESARDMERYDQNLQRWDDYGVALSAEGDHT